jgi:hypothetical protein
VTQPGDAVSEKAHHFGQVRIGFGFSCTPPESQILGIARFIAAPAGADRSNALSCQHHLTPSTNIESHKELDAEDVLLQVNLRLRLDEAANVEAERLRVSARRKPSKHELSRLAKRIYDARRLRERVMQDRLFGEPAWDMMLELYSSASSISSLSYAANCAPTTGLRWQKVLIQDGLIERGPPGFPAYKQIVRLTESGRDLMDEYLTRLFYCESQMPALLREIA